MKVNKKLFCFALAAMTLSSCNMDYNEYTAYDKEYIQRSFKYVGWIDDNDIQQISIPTGATFREPCSPLQQMSLNIATMATR